MLRAPLIPRYHQFCFANKNVNFVLTATDGRQRRLFLLIASFVDQRRRGRRQLRIRKVLLSVRVVIPQARKHTQRMVVIVV